MAKREPRCDRVRRLFLAGHSFGVIGPLVRRRAERHRAGFPARDATEKARLSYAKRPGEGETVTPWHAKLCSHCRRWLPRRLFDRDPSMPGGRKYTCRACRRARRADLAMGAPRLKPWQRRRLDFVTRSEAADRGGRESRS